MLQNNLSQSNLSESELLFTSVFEQVAVGLAYLDLEGYYQMVNQKFCEIVGYSQSELLTKNFAEITHPEDLTVSRSLNDQLAASEIPVFAMEKRYIRKDGAWAWAELNVSLFRSPDGQPKWLLAAITDISARKRSEEEIEVRVRERAQELDQSKIDLRQQEEQFRTIFEHAPIAITLTDLNTFRHFKVNQATCDMLGYTDQELAQKTFLELTHPDDVQENLDALKPLMEGEISQFCLEKRYIRKNGEVIWGNITVTLIRDQQGTPLYNLGMVVNVTERKKAEAILRASEEQVRVSLLEKEVLLKEIHHRVKNNMQVVSSLLSLQASAIHDPKILAPLKEIQNRVKVMGQIHERFYQSENLSKINFPEYVQGLIQDVINSYSPVSLQTELDLEIADIGLGIDTVIPCGLILHELVSNVIKHAFPNPGSHRIRIKFTADCVHQGVLTVADNGVGLPESIEPNDTESLGLQIVSALTMKLQGTLECDRHNGTTFNIRFTY
jgi:PAS domain S-box-containing protein